MLMKLRERQKIYVAYIQLRSVRFIIFFTNWNLNKNSNFATNILCDIIMSCENTKVNTYIYLDTLLNNLILMLVSSLHSQI